MTQILRFPNERVRPPGLKINKTSASFSLLLTPIAFEAYMRSCGLRYTIVQTTLTKPPAFPALTYVPSSP